MQMVDDVEWGVGAVTWCGWWYSLGSLPCALLLAGITNKPVSSTYAPDPMHALSRRSLSGNDWTIACPNFVPQAHMHAPLRVLLEFRALLGPGGLQKIYAAAGTQPVMAVIGTCITVHVDQ